VGRLACTERIANINRYEMPDRLNGRSEPVCSNRDRETLFSLTVWELGHIGAIYGRTTHPRLTHEMRWANSAAAANAVDVSMISRLAE
jgi:hypothetical protein